MYLPFVMAVYSLLMGGDVMGTVLGILVGHFYYVGKEVFGRQNPTFARLFQAPAALQRLVGHPGQLKGGQSVTTGAGFTMHAPKRPFAKQEAKEEEGQRFRAFAGSGNKLGSE